MALIRLLEALETGKLPGGDKSDRTKAERISETSKTEKKIQEFPRSESRLEDKEPQVMWIFTVSRLDSSQYQVHTAVALGLTPVGLDPGEPCKLCSRPGQ